MAGLIYVNWQPVAKALTDGGQGEPVALLQGVSLWPPILIRVLTVLVSICLLVRSWRKLKINIYKISENMALMSPHETLEKEKNNHKGESQFKYVGGIFSTISRFSRGTNGIEGCYNLESAWGNLVYQGRFWARFWRVSAYVLLMFCMLKGFEAAFGHPNVPARGKLAADIYGVITLADISLLFFLLFFVVDATHSFWLFVSELGPIKSTWPRNSRRYYAQKLDMNETDPLLDYWMDIDFIASRSRCLGELIYYPFAVLALIIISRSSAFAAFALSWTIIMAWGLSFLILLICAFLLRRRLIHYGNM